MKLPLPIVLSCYLGAAASGPAQAQDDDFPRGGVTETKFAVTVKDATPDEYLMTLARTADVNIIADATAPEGRAPVVQAPITSQYNASLFASLVRFGRDQKMRSKRFGQRTFLFWRPPQDAALVARQIVAENQAALHALPQLNGGQISNLWFEYFKQQHGWQGERDATIDVKIVDLPEPLRSGTLAAAQAKMLQGPGKSYEFFVPGSLDKMRLQSAPEDMQDGKGGVPYLHWMVPLRGGSYTSPIGRLDALAALGGAR